MSIQVCVLARWEADDYIENGNRPDCTKHKHIKLKEAREMVSGWARLHPETPETLHAQVDALANGTNKAVYFPTGQQNIPAAPEGANITVVRGDQPGAGTWYHTDEIMPQQIHAAVKDGTFGQLLGLKPVAEWVRRVERARDANGSIQTVGLMPGERVNWRLDAVDQGLLWVNLKTREAVKALPDAREEKSERRITMLAELAKVRGLSARTGFDATGNTIPNKGLPETGDERRARNEGKEAPATMSIVADGGTIDWLEAMLSQLRDAQSLRPPQTSSRMRSGNSGSDIPFTGNRIVRHTSMRISG